ncbi:uncharacterized protein [Dermacentor albipictus]|uniref:uncharacterized protein n=1 Tax=Dermacentor albipictus TaxID=60249 RepID=UPI0031FCF186
MLASSSNRRSQPPRCSSPPSMRRVYFPNTTIQDRNDKASPSSLQTFPALCGKHVLLTQPSAHSSSATDGFWDRYSPQHYRPDLAPVDSSTTSLFGRRPPSPAALIADQQAITHRPFSPRPGPHCSSSPFGSGWSDDFDQPSSDATFQATPPAEDGGTSGLSWLRNIGVGMLVAAILTVALTMALTMDLQDSDIGPWPATPMPRGMENIGSRKIAIPLRPIIVPQDRRHGAIFRPVSEAHNVTRRLRPAPRSEPPRLPWPQAENRTLSHRCGHHFYTYCHERRYEVYYSATLRACTSTEAGSVHVCNHGANRFASMDSCLTSCVHVANGRPQDRCYEATLFATCSWQDATETWWYYDGTACAEWNFPLGNCPLQDERVFRTRLECDEACLRRQRGGGRRRCDAPDAATCTPPQLKYPYFASMLANGAARCVSASGHELSRHRCLVGSNRFESVASCERACVNP